MMEWNQKVVTVWSVGNRCAVTSNSTRTGRLLDSLYRPRSRAPNGVVNHHGRGVCVTGQR